MASVNRMQSVSTFSSPEETPLQRKVRRIQEKISDSSDWYRIKLKEEYGSYCIEIPFGTDILQAVEDFYIEKFIEEKYEVDSHIFKNEGNDTIDERVTLPFCQKYDLSTEIMLNYGDLLYSVKEKHNLSYLDKIEFVEKTFSCEGCRENDDNLHQGKNGCLSKK